jgi:hypothetical protein
MALFEQSERIGGATLVGVPIFDFFVWALDNYARMELLVRLHGLLPHFLTSPLTIFLCLCAGLGLLYRSERRYLQRIAENSVNRHRIVDTSGTEIATIEKPSWALPLGVVFLLALIATPIVAVGYSLAYKGVAPKIPIAPHPPYLAYAKTKHYSRTVTPSTPSKTVVNQTTNAPYSANVLGSNNQVNINDARRLSDSDREILKKGLAGINAKFRFAAIIAAPDAYQYAADLREAFIAAGLDVEDSEMPVKLEMLLSGKRKPWEGIQLSWRGETAIDYQLSSDTVLGKIADAMNNAHAPITSAHAGLNEPEGIITVTVGMKPEKTQN